MKVVMKRFHRLWGMIGCGLLGHNEELYRKQQDHRYLVWVCSRCEKVTRDLKMTPRQMRHFRKVTRVH